MQSAQYSVTPKIVQTMPEESRTVLGVAATSGHVFVVRAESPEIEVYSAVTLSLKRRIPVAGLRAPTDLVACESVGCLFVSDWPECRIHRVAVQTCRQEATRAAINGKSLAESQTTEMSEEKENWLKEQETGWWTNERPWSLSLVERQRSSCTILVTCDQVYLICIARIIV